MKFFLYFLTIAFGIVCFVIMKKKRYKVMPLICLIMFICFIGFGIISLVYSFVPYGEIFVMPLWSIVFGLISILVGVNDLYSLLCCRKKVDGVYCGYNTYYGGNVFLHKLQYLNIHITEHIIVSKQHRIYLIND